MTTKFINVISDGEEPLLLGRLIGVDGAAMIDRVELSLMLTRLDHFGREASEVANRYPLARLVCDLTAVEMLGRGAHPAPPSFVPSYAVRRTSETINGIQWVWRAMEVTLDQYQELFDSDAFEPADELETTDG